MNFVKCVNSTFVDTIEIFFFISFYIDYSFSLLIHILYMIDITVSYPFFIIPIIIITFNDLSFLQL